jgi:hypothetical protein
VKIFPAMDSRVFLIFIKLDHINDNFFNSNKFNISTTNSEDYVREMKSLNLDDSAKSSGML